MADRIATALEVLVVSLANASRDIARTAEMAETAIANGHRNQAVGCLLEVEQQISDLTSYFDAVLALHRTTR